MTTAYKAPSTDLPRPSLRAVRIGDIERHDACGELSAHFAAGRLTGDELDERLAAAIAARTAVDLQWIVADLPPIQQEPAESTSPAAAPTAPSGASEWGAGDIIVLLVFIGCVAVAGCALWILMMAGAYMVTYIVAGTLSAIVAGTGGAAAVHLAHRSNQRHLAAAADRVPRRRAAEEPTSDGVVR